MDRYYEFGPEKGEKVLLVHGISVPSPTWGKITPQLTKAGYRVCLVDLFGRGYSDSPQVPYDSSLYVSQLALLLAALPDWTKFHLIGQSMGGGIVASFAYYFPDRIDKLVLVCPAGATPRPELPLLNRFFVSSWLSVGGMRALLPFAPVPLPNSPETIPGWQLRHHKGFLHSFLVRNALVVTFLVASTSPPTTNENLCYPCFCVWNNNSRAYAVAQSTTKRHSSTWSSRSSEIV